VALLFEIVESCSELAMAMVADAVAAGLPFRWVSGW
jgi:hypothetical protein